MDKRLLCSIKKHSYTSRRIWDVGGEKVVNTTYIHRLPKKVQVGALFFFLVALVARERYGLLTELLFPSFFFGGRNKVQSNRPDPNAIHTNNKPILDEKILKLLNRPINPPPPLVFITPHHL